MRYSTRPPKRTTTRRLLAAAGILLVLIISATITVRHLYFENLKPVSSFSSKPQLITIEKGSSVDEIAKQLKDAGLIRSPWAFKLYVSSKNVRESLEAGTYSFERNQSVAEIVSQLTHGKVATNLVTIIPGQTIWQIRTTLINYGFKAADVDNALKPSNYPNNPALVDLPAGASLEGYIYPDSYQKNSNTTPKEIITQALAQMDKRLTPDLRNAFGQQGLSAYQAIVLASIIEQEVSNQGDRAQVAQVFLSRIRQGMVLGSDITAIYGAHVLGVEPSTTVDSPYNTYIFRGLPIGPVGNVSQSSLEAVAHPANTDWLYFVAGDDGATHFSHTLQEHEAATAQYCHKLCGQ